MKTKKIAELLVCLTLFSVNIFACQVPVGSNAIEEIKSQVSNLLTISLIFLIFTIVLSFFKKGWERLIPILISSAIFGFAWDTRNVESDCGIGAVQTSKIALAIIFVCFLAQFITWLMFRKRHAELS